MKRLGSIVRLQVQRGSLKRVEEGRKVFDPRPLLPVSELTLTSAGAWARAEDGSFIVDVHNAAHPQSRNRDSANPLSLLFTSHYRRMQERFGAHLSIGCAGESMLIDTDEIVGLDQVARGVVIENAAGTVRLERVIVAEPCVPFSQFALRAPDAAPAELKSALQFLGQGMRGFYCQPGNGAAAAATIAIGDVVYAA